MALERATNPRGERGLWHVPAALTLLVLVVLPACVTVTPESPGRLASAVKPEPIPEHLWPPRLAVEFPLTSPTVGTTELENVERPVSFWIPHDDLKAWLTTMSAGGAMMRLGVWGRGHLGLVMLPPGGTPPPEVAWTRMLLFFTAAEYSDLPYSSLVRPTTVPADAPRPLESSLTVMRFYEPKGAPKGLVVHLTGIRGVDQEAYVPSAFTRRGWAVLSIPPPSTALQKESVKHWRAGTPLDHEAGLEAEAEHLARLTDWGMADWAYAAESGVMFLLHSHPELAGKPRVLLGCSMGALALPAVAARNPGRFGAAVLVAGGGSLLRVVHESGATASEFDLRWSDGSFSGEDWDRLDRLTQERARLDPLKAARFLAGIPVLQLHASFDDIVPRETGERLYEALGKPERWSYPVGHIGMFAIFPFQVGAVADWVESKTQAP